MGKYIRRDFSETIPVSGNNKEFTQLVNGVNAMANAMQSLLLEKESAEHRIKKLETELAQKNSTEAKVALDIDFEYRSLIEQATDGIFISDDQGKYEIVNVSACKLLGYSQDELLRMNVRDVLVPEEMVSQPPRFNELKEGKTILSHRRLRKKDGTVFSVEINAKMLSNGKMLGMVRDITDRKQTEERIRKLNEELEKKVAERTEQLENNIRQLKESEEKFQKSFHASPAAISLTRLSDARFVDVNPTFSQLTGYSKDELIGHSSVELGLVVSIDKREEVLKQVQKQGSARDFEITVRNKSGNPIILLASIETIVWQGEKHAINILFDITERKRAMQQLELLNDDLNSFSYSVSHDLRAPLRAIAGYSEILVEDYGPKLDEGGQRAINIIKSNVSKMSHLIDDLLAFSRLGRKEVQKGRIDLFELVNKVLIEINKSPHRAQIRIGALDQVNADQSLLFQVVHNLLSNAIKYSSKKEYPVIEIQSERKDREIVFSVSDNGTGFDMNYVDKLFGVFQRLHSNQEFEGTGVGLAIVHRIITRHGGRVWAEGKKNEGAKFFFALPDIE